MSQNAHSLLLFFDDEIRHKHCLLMFLKLNKGDDTQAQTWAQRLGVDIREEWNEHWFNHSVSAQPEYLRIDYETSSGYELPFNPLKQLFASGLKAAVLEIFHDQVGESSRYHFLDNRWVKRDDLYRAKPDVAEVVAAQIEQNDDDEDYSISPDAPMLLDEMIKKHRRREDEAQELVSSFLDLAKAARETNSNPLDVIKSALIMRAMIIGVLQALAFTVVTVLLFKGIWLWIGLGVILLVVLPIWKVMAVNKDFSDGEGERDAD